MTDIEYLKKYYNGDINEAISKLEKGIPVQYIVGNVDFYGITLDVNSNVLIPRFETEELVSKVLEYAPYFDNPRIADIGTGSGCIAIALKKYMKCDVWATDISKQALAVAKKNAKKNNVSITFKQGNLLDALDGKFDILVSNPPYIAYDEQIMDIVKNNEPSIALYADNNGIYYYEEILKNVKKYLKDKFIIAFEIGYKQGNALKKLSLKYLNIEAEVLKDISGKDRFVFIKLL